LIFLCEYQKLQYRDVQKTIGARDVDAFCSQPKTRVEARPDFIWIRCNPLKSPDSAKEKQGNAGFGAFITRTENIRQNCGEASRVKGGTPAGSFAYQPAS
jgi:hypothetical protein